MMLWRRLAISIGMMFVSSSGLCSLTIRAGVSKIASPKRYNGRAERADIQLDRCRSSGQIIVSSA
jgi:hypothetical protein